MPTCECANYDHLELTREAINKRARASTPLKSRLDQLAEHPDREHRLLKCSACGQHWQRSLAWNWGQKEYLFRVPPVEVEEWASRPFVQPDELLVFVAALGRFLEQQSFEPTDRGCRRDGCDRPAVELSAFCRAHHIEQLQAAQSLPQSPAGRWFEPYLEHNFAVPA